MTTRFEEPKLDQQPFFKHEQQPAPKLTGSIFEEPKLEQPFFRQGQMPSPKLTGSNFGKTFDKPSMQVSTDSFTLEPFGDMPVFDKLTVGKQIAKPSRTLSEPLSLPTLSFDKPSVERQLPQNTGSNFFDESLTVPTIQVSPDSFTPFDKPVTQIAKRPFEDQDFKQ